MFHQQETMFKKDTHSIADRIISIFQPHIPPIVRGKAKATTEFSAKIGASVVHGYTFIENHSLDAYNEEANLELQIELYRKRFGCLPSRIYADKIYMNRENRNLMKNLEIEAMGKPLERPLKILIWSTRREGQWQLERGIKWKPLLERGNGYTAQTTSEQSYRKRQTVGRVCAILSRM